MLLVLNWGVEMGQQCLEVMDTLEGEQSPMQTRIARSGTAGTTPDLVPLPVIMTKILNTVVDVKSFAVARDQTEAVYLLLEHLAANGRERMARFSDPDQTTCAPTRSVLRPRGRRSQ
jgi:hypothetical protein